MCCADIFELKHNYYLLSWQKHNSFQLLLTNTKAQQRLQFTLGIIPIINESSLLLLDEKGRHAKSQCTLQKTCNKDVYFSTEVLGECLCRTDYQIIENIIADEFPLSRDILSD